MPLGATTSAPARAWLAAWRASSSSVASLSTSTPAGRFRQHAAVAMIGVLAKADVGDDQHVGGPFGRFDRPLDDSLVAVRIAAQRIFGVGNAEQNHAAQAQARRPA